MTNIDYEHKKEYKDMNFEEKFIEWNTYFRRNIHRFVEYYLELDMYLYQKILLFLMNLCPLVVVVACRATAKSFVIAVYSCAKCILYPGSKIVIASATKKQAGLIVSEKIQKELMPVSINLRREIKDIKVGQNATEVIFHNTSSIVVVPASDNARGYRGTVMIYEEFRMVKKDIIDFVLSPFLIVRQAPYLKKEEYSNLTEEPMEIYISSAFYKSHWMNDMIHLAVTEMYNTSEALLIGFDYATTLKHKIRTKKQLRKEKKKMGSIAFAMEYENEMIGGSENQYYSYDLVSSAQKIKKAWYPLSNEDYLAKRKPKIGNIEKQKNEIRLVSMDIAVSESTDKIKNDNSVIKCVRVLLNGNSYERQEVYTEVFQGKDMDSQAIRVRQIMNDFKADYFIFDARTYGTIMTDTMAKTLYDSDRDVEYSPISVFNNKELANRCKNKSANPIMWAFVGSAENNHNMHTYMKTALLDGKYKMLINSTKCTEEYLDKNSEYKKASMEDKINYELPYTQSDLTLTEMVNLKKEFVQGAKIKLIEPSTGTKDRYVTSGMANLFVQEELEVKLTEEKQETNIMDYCSFF